MVTIRAPRDDEFEAMVRVDVRQFGDAYEPKNDESLRRILELDRFRLAYDDDRIVGVSGAYSKQLVVPGGARLDASGVTWVSVVPTHTRRGLLRAMIGALHDDARDRGEPVAILMASEGSIYERFGYGAATVWRGIRLDSRRARFAERFRQDRRSIRIVDKDEGITEVAARWRAAWATARPGEVSRSDAFATERFRLDDRELRFALADDGYAAWSVKSVWTYGDPGFEVEVADLQAASVETERALWETVLAVDLAGPIDARLPLDHPLPLWLENPRHVTTPGMHDNLWVHVLDPVAAFSARSYEVDDRLVVGTERGTWSIGTDGTTGADGASPDLAGDHAALGPLLLGGVTASQLAHGGRLQARDPDVLARADRLFTTAVLPYTTTNF